MKKFPIKNLVTLIQKRFLSTSIGVSSSQLQESSSFTVQYLINSCGLSSKSAISTSQKLKLDENKTQNLNSVLEFLKSNGFDETQIAKLIEKRPEILCCRVKDNLKPKWDYLIQNGYSGTILTELIVSNPEITKRSLHGQIKPSLEFLKEICGSSDNVIRTVKRSKWLFTSNLDKAFKPNVDLLIKAGVPVSNVSKLLVLNPRALAQNCNDFVRHFNAVKELGLDLKSPGFVLSLKVFIQMSEDTLKKKIKVFESLGWTQEDILSMFRKYTFCFARSEEKIRSTMDFFVKTVKVEPKFVITYPILLNYAMDKLSRRYNILKVLESKNLIVWDNRVAWLLTKSDKRFKTYVGNFEKKVPGLLEMYEGTVNREKLDTFHD